MKSYMRTGLFGLVLCLLAALVALAMPGEAAAFAPVILDGALVATIPLIATINPDGAVSFRVPNDARPTDTKVIECVLAEALDGHSVAELQAMVDARNEKRGGQGQPPKIEPKGTTKADLVDALR